MSHSRFRIPTAHGNRASEVGVNNRGHAARMVGCCLFILIVLVVPIVAKAAGYDWSFGATISKPTVGSNGLVQPGRYQFLFDHRTNGSKFFVLPLGTAITIAGDSLKFSKPVLAEVQGTCMTSIPRPHAADFASSINVDEGLGAMVVVARFKRQLELNSESSVVCFALLPTVGSAVHK